jgi:hypothetical protein
LARALFDSTPIMRDGAARNRRAKTAGVRVQTPAERLAAAGGGARAGMRRAPSEREVNRREVRECESFVVPCAAG